MVTTSEGFSPNAEQVKHGQFLLSVAVALVPALDTNSVSMLYRVIKPSIQHGEDAEMYLQKRAYRALACICRHHRGWVRERKKELAELLSTTLSCTSSGSKRSRLECLRHIFAVAFPANSTDSSTVMSSEDLYTLVRAVLGEAVLAVKEPNHKTRIGSFRLLSQIAKCVSTAHSVHNIEGSGYAKFVEMLTAGLAARSTHMQSATVVALARALWILEKTTGFKTRCQRFVVLFFCLVCPLTLQEKFKLLWLRLQRFASHVCTWRSH